MDPLNFLNCQVHTVSTLDVFQNLDFFSHLWMFACIQNKIGVGAISKYKAHICSHISYTHTHKAILYFFFLKTEFHCVAAVQSWNSV